MHTTYPVCLEIRLADCPTADADAQLHDLDAGQRVSILGDYDQVLATNHTTTAGDPVWVTGDGQTFKGLDAAIDHHEECELAPIAPDAYPYQVLCGELRRVVNLLHKVNHNYRRGGAIIADAQARLRDIIRDIDYSSGTPDYINARQRLANLGPEFNARDFADDVDF